MTPQEFAKRRDRILHHSPGRSNDWRRRALKRLAADAAAIPQATTGGRVLSWRMPSGKHVCAKHRYRCEDSANHAMGNMQREQDGRRKPIRAYACYYCFGWHITSQAK